MAKDDLRAVYREYIACLNRQDWARLGEFVHEDVRHNQRPFGLAGYHRMLEESYATIPDLTFVVERLVAEASHVASRLRFVCTPTGEFLGLPVNGRRVTFHENIFYAFRERRIAEAWSILDKTALEAQLERP